MKRIFTLLAFSTVLSFGANAQNVNVDGVCSTSDLGANYDQDVTWIFDLTSIGGFTAGDSLWLHTWQPTPAQTIGLEHVTGKIYRMTWNPVTLWGYSSGAFEINGSGTGDNNFWFNIQATGSTVVANPDYAQKEVLRLATTDCDTDGSWSQYLPTGVDADEIGQASVSPNPFTSDITIATDAQGDVSVALYDLTGTQVYSGSASGNGSSVTISPDVASGTYIVTVSAGGSVVAYSKVVKQ